MREKLIKNKSNTTLSVSKSFFFLVASRNSTVGTFPPFRYELELEPEGAERIIPRRLWRETIDVSCVAIPLFGSLERDLNPFFLVVGKS